MHLHFERNANAKCDCTILSLSWMGKVPDELPEEEGWKLNRNNYYQEGWLATGNVRGVVGVTFTTSHSRRSVELPLRTNYNLRGHRSEVILVKWNEPYQKLASCDSSGVIFVWIKYEGRWSIELINDRSTPVTHFSWSHDGRMALICYQDGFVLVGSVAGQRYWSSMLTLEARITCGCWTPDDAHVYLGTAAAQLVVMDVHGAMVSQVQLSAEGGIIAMAWSCEKFKMEEAEEDTERTVNHVLAVAFGSGEIILLRGYDDVSPARIITGLDGSTLAMEWANNKELLAVAGTVKQDNNNEQAEIATFKNVVKFYSDTGSLIYTAVIPYTQDTHPHNTSGNSKMCGFLSPLPLVISQKARVSCMTWGHAGRRLFVSCGGVVCTARVWRVVAPLALLARVRAAQALPSPLLAARLPLPPRLVPLVTNLFAHTIRCCVPEPQQLRRFVSRPPAAPARLHCTMLRHDDEDSGYTLYLEHLGGLVPLLKGRRTSKIRPEFVIFDPQADEVMVKGLESVRESSSSSSSGSSSASSNSGRAPRPPRTPRTPRHNHSVQSPTDTSDSDREDGCSGSPRLQRKRRARERRKNKISSEKEDNSDELAYIDSLPEDVRLVEVTSNIWGTKFKMHGLAKNVPANLGQVTYKTSLLHLQPRQMTLVITELRDDYPVGPDPNFNPNIFSEDEEDGFQSNKNSPSKNNNITKKKSSAIEKPNVSNHNDALNANITNNNNTVASLAKPESYEEEFPYIDVNEVVNSYSETVYSPIPTRHTAHTSERRVSATTSVSNRHAISPLRCDGSVPTLQSPKNAVAPTDIIFERPSPQTVTCGGRGDFYGGRAEYSVRSDNVALKGNLEQSSFNINIEPSRHITIKKSDTHITENCLTKLRKNICNRGEPASYEINSRIIKTVYNKNFEQEVHPDALVKRAESLKLQKNEDLKFIDEETPTETNAVERVKEIKVQRTTTVVPISPVCTSMPVYDTMTRSCSVGYLDLVDPQILRANSSIAALRGAEPKRLVLVNTKKSHRKPLKKHGVKSEENKQSYDSIELKSPTLKRCGKSKSLDSSELSITNNKKPIKLDLKIENDGQKSSNTDMDDVDSGNESESSVICARGRREYPVCTVCRLVSPYDRRAVDAARYVCAACVAPAPSAPPPTLAHPQQIDTDYSKYYTSLEQLALRLRAARSGRGRERAPHASRERDLEARECASAPASPRPARSQPAATSKIRTRARNSSSSPIRQLLNSPLLNRRRNKKQSESSDEETSGLQTESINGRNYRDLESFQKQQLRNKLKRGKGELQMAMGSGVNHVSKRQLVMHNKAPMWNENSQVYQLDFGGRVTQESAKNFQIEFHGKQVMQFGRIDGNAYTLDFQHPFSALQAFAVALANVTQRLK